VISGYVITASLYETSDRNLAEFLFGFYSRRIKRLAPALILCVLITSLLISFFNKNPLSSLETGGASLFGLSNLYLLKQATDYFGASAQLNVFTHTWSLGVEEQFYVVFPFIIWLAGFGRQHKQGGGLFIIIGLLALGSLTAFVRLSISHNPVAFFLMPTRFWELSAGCLVFVAQTASRWLVLDLQVTRVGSLVTMPVLVAILFIPDEYSAYSTIAVVLLTASLIACTLSALQDRGKISIVDLIDVFCPNKTCTYSLPDRQILYRDVLSHPSVEAARLSGPPIRDVLIAPLHSRSN
jgi:peptidoglycan/LPS O-acetylase OafA/YrhL